MATFRRHYLRILTRPAAGFVELLQDPERFSLGFRAILLNAILYTLVYVFLWHGGGAPSNFAPWLAIPKEAYYSYNRFLLLPSMLLAWIAAAGIAQLLSKPFGGRGTFENTLSVFGFATSIACLASLAHDLPDSFLGAIGLLNLKEYEVLLNSPTVWRGILWALYTLSVGWFFVLYIKGIRAAQQISRRQAILVGAIGYLSYQIVFLVFNR